MNLLGCEGCCVTSVDGMYCRLAHLPYEFLAHVSSGMINQRSRYYGWLRYKQHAACSIECNDFVQFYGLNGLQASRIP